MVPLHSFGLAFFLLCSQFARKVRGLGVLSPFMDLNEYAFYLRRVYDLYFFVMIKF